MSGEAEIHMFTVEDIRSLRLLAISDGVITCALLWIAPDALIAVLCLAVAMVIVPIVAIYVLRRVQSKKKPNQAPEPIPRPRDGPS